ncbi:MAG: hypothetical protein FRX48_04071 [Lasallia pustulata]|uniref:Uncharacterized protein n=1 Tax=Lasallia pustulata TaxID=136370 RepID=A0A5M8PQX4_9LECA|nr:MAG: hypothetical protein FRX48_04071 [Lasallia pustulata]
MARPPLPHHVDTVVVGNGPSALILSYILHGNIPHYDPSKHHPDPILHAKLLKFPCLLNSDVDDLTAHFNASRLSYSTQALPINVLLDTLLRPLADTEPGKLQSCLQWRHEPGKSVSHVLLGNTPRAGGQWADNPVAASWDIGALSYLEMLSLPGYSFTEHYTTLHGKPPVEFHRPTRRGVADYLATYPERIGISDTIYTSTTIENVVRTTSGFHISPHNIHCRHLVLASGTFSHLIPPRPLLQPLLSLPPPSTLAAPPPTLVVGSGFTAADIIISTPAHQKIIHIFKWAPDERPSPLRACHPQAYPEYAGVYRRMKLAVIKASGPKDVVPPLKRGKSSSLFESRDWESVYEGLPNTVIKGVEVQEDGAIVTLQGDDGSSFERKVAGLEYVVGRRGSLQYLEDDLQAEVLSHDGGIVGDAASISGLTLRAKVNENLEVAPDVFVIGSLTGDSLVRFAFGGCVYAAREMIRRKEKASPLSLRTVNGSVIPDGKTSKNAGAYHKAAMKEGKNASLRDNGHTDLGVDGKERRREYFDLDVDVDGEDSALSRKDAASSIDLELAWAGIGVVGRERYPFVA